MLLSGVSGLSSTIGCRVCRDCRDCRATVGVSLTVHARGACREIYYSLSGAVGLLSVLSGVGAVGTVERLSGSCRVRVSECRARAQGTVGCVVGCVACAQYSAGRVIRTQEHERLRVVSRLCILRPCASFERSRARPKHSTFYVF